MSNIKEKALEYHAAGFNCAQSVLAACNEYTGLDDSAALAISAGFGGGLRSGEICGAISGAVMALGLVCPFNEADNAEAKVKIAELAKNCVSACNDEYNYCHLYTSDAADEEDSVDLGGRRITNNHQP